MPPLKPWQTIPVPPPTAPSSTAPPSAPASAEATCSGLTWKPLMSLRKPSQVSPTTGRLQRAALVAVLGGGDERIADDTDGVRVREPDRRRQQPGVADPLEPGQLTVAVDPVRAGEERLGAAAGRR